MNFEVREAYCPAHFGNSYEAMWPLEMAAYLDELKYWGFNRYGDWMTSTDSCDPYVSDATWNLPMEMFARKKAAFRHAAKIGLQNNLIITANHVFLDQLRPDLLAARDTHIFGQLLCPSIPEARDIIHRNFENQFRDLAESGVELSAFTAFAYDYGGCNCERCAPWILTFAELTSEIHEIARRYFPDIEPWMCAWWWKPEEYEAVADWAARTRPGWLKSLVFHIPYNETGFAEQTVPAGCRTLGFIHDGYGDVNGNGDIYTKFGAVITPRRLPATLERLEAQGASGFQVYSEGVFDDVNKVLIASLASGRAGSVDEALREYATRYFGVEAAGAARWSEWLTQWGVRGEVKLDAAEREFEALVKTARSGWRLEHWRCKLRLEKLDRLLARGGESWDAERLELAEQFWAEREHLQRDVYRLGPVRHIFAPHFSAPIWFESWQNEVRQQHSRSSNLPSEA